MGVLLNVTSGVPGVSEAFSTFMSGPYGTDNPALGIQYDSQFGYILTIICGAVFLFEALFAATNLAREGFCVHFWVVIFCFERIATFVFRALLYKQRQIAWIKAFEILEALGTALVVSTAFLLLAGFIRSRKQGRSCCASTWKGAIVLAATAAISAGAGMFAAGAWLQDQESTTQARFNTGFNLRQYAVIVYGGVLLVYLIICFVASCFHGRRGIAIQLWIVGAALGAKAGFQIYALWTSDQPLGVQRFYSNRFYFSLLVFPELLAVSFMTSKNFVGKALRPARNVLPFTSPFEGANQPPHRPQYQPAQRPPADQYGAFFGNGSNAVQHPYAARSTAPPKSGGPPAELARLQQGSVSHQRSQR